MRTELVSAIGLHAFCGAIQPHCLLFSHGVKLFVHSSCIFELTAQITQTGSLWALGPLHQQVLYILSILECEFHFFLCPI